MLYYICSLDTGFQLTAGKDRSEDRVVNHRDTVVTKWVL